jgi:N-acetylmuramic acid 6-phosphate etherase
MLALPNLETVGRGCLAPSASMMAKEALFADALLVPDWRAIAFVAAPLATSAQMLAATWYTGGWLVTYAGVGSSGLAVANNAAGLPGSFGLDESRVAAVLASATADPFCVDAAAEDGEQAMAARGDAAREAMLAVSPIDSTACCRRCRQRGALSRRLCDRRATSPWLALALQHGRADSLREQRGGFAGAASAAQNAVLDMFSLRERTWTCLPRPES